MADDEIVAVLRAINKTLEEIKSALAQIAHQYSKSQNER